MRFRKRKEEPRHERPEVEGIRMAFSAVVDGVVMTITDAAGVEEIFNITLAPEYARDAAFKLSWYAMQAETGNVPGDQKEGNA